MVAQEAVASCMDDDAWKGFVCVAHVISLGLAVNRLVPEQDRQRMFTTGEEDSCIHFWCNTTILVYVSTLLDYSTMKASCIWRACGPGAE